MNLGDIIISVQRQFGDDTEAQITTEDISRWANDGQLEIARRTEVLLLTHTTETVIEQREYPLPADFLRANRVMVNGTVIKRTSSSSLDIVAPSRDVTPYRGGTPTGYYIRRKTIQLYPAPEAVVSLVIEYNARPTTLVETDDIPEIPVEMHQDIVRYCMIRARELDGDRTGAKEANIEFDARLSISADENWNPYSDTYPSIREVD